MEEWRAHPKYLKVEVSSEGRVRTFYRYPEGRVVSGGVSNGYRSVYIAEADRTVTVHVLVAETFHPNPEGHKFVLHKDDDRLNNRKGNLYWGTPKQNSQDAVKNGKWASGEKHYSAKLTKQVVEYARSVYKPNDSEFGGRALARQFGVSQKAMKNAITGVTWK